MQHHEWLVFVSHLPGKENASRMRVWRGLRAAGAAILRDGVYLLPHTPRCRALLEEHADTVREAGGSAYVLNSAVAGDQDDGELCRLFDRRDDYLAWQREVAQLSARLVGLDEAKARRSEASARRALEAIADTDFFPADDLSTARTALAALSESINARFSPDEPTAVAGDLRPRERARYQGRTWVTRKRLWIDRVASAWLIRRFIDPGARFLWKEAPGECPVQAVGFDFDGAEFTHVGSRVTFEVLLHAFQMESDPALLRLGRLVHFLDVGGTPVPEAPGVLALLVGARQRCDADDAFLDSAGAFFDDLYGSFASGDPSGS